MFGLDASSCLSRLVIVNSLFRFVVMKKGNSLFKVVD